jgi:hypothetical protein
VRKNTVPVVKNVLMSAGISLPHDSGAGAGSWTFKNSMLLPGSPGTTRIPIWLQLVPMHGRSKRPQYARTFELISRPLLPGVSAFAPATP